MADINAMATAIKKINPAVIIDRLVGPQASAQNLLNTLASAPLQPTNGGVGGTNAAGSFVQAVPPSYDGFLFYATGHGSLQQTGVVSYNWMVPIQQTAARFFTLTQDVLNAAQNGDPPTLTVDYSGVDAANVVQVLLNGVTLGYLAPGQTQEVFDLPTNSLEVANDLTVQNGESSNVTIQSVIFSSGDVPLIGVTPAVSSLTAAAPAEADGEIVTGQTLLITVAMNESVTINTPGGSPTLTLNDNATATYDASASDPSAGTLVFDYTVGPTDYTTNLAVSGVNLNGSTIQDVNGVNANLSGAAQSLGLDVNAALVTAVTASQTGEVGAGQTVLLTLTMSEGVTVNTSLGSPTLSLNDGATATYDANA